MSKLWEPGDRIEKWLVLERFMGAWGVVYVLQEINYDKNLSRPEILIGKTVRPEWADNDSLVKQFEQEAYAWLSLSIYKHIVRLYFVDRIYKLPFAFAEYVPEVLLPNTLRGWMDSALIDTELALRFGIQICRALSYARSCGILLHQDLKPENVMITSAGVSKVTDWGLSRMMPVRNTEMPTMGDIPYRFVSPPVSPPSVYGTPGYAAPELYSAKELPTPGADVFSLGVMLTEMITGKRPKADTSAAELIEMIEPLTVPVSSELASVISTCLSSDPARRPQSTEAVENVLKDAFTKVVGVPVEPAPVKSWETGADQGQRAYALFMLGKTDEAMKLQTELMQYLDRRQSKTGSEVKPESDRRHAIIMMDYKELGFKTIVPAEMVDEIEENLKANPDDPKMLDKAININHLANRLDRALELCLSWLKRRPDDQEKIKKVAGILNQQGNLKQALVYIDKAIALSPNDAKLWIERSEYYEKSGDRQNAMMSAKRAVEIEPDNEIFRLTYGHILEQNGDKDAALSEFQQVTRLNPDNALGWYNVGTCWNHLERPDLAFENLMRAVEKNPNFAVALNTLGALSMQIYAFQEALVFFERAIAADAHYARPWFNKGKALEYLEQYEQAREAYLMAVQIDPNYELAKQALEQLISEHLL
jgi:tetratricopeptide (TPR) repeat protein